MSSSAGVPGGAADAAYPAACCRGVLRGSLLASGEATECVIYEADLHSAAELYLGNALRGLVRVSL